MYLTRFRFNTARRGARSLLASPQRLHAAVLHGFPNPDQLNTADMRLLWRVDRASRHDALIYLVSPEAPDLTHMVEDAGWPTRDDGWESRPYGPLLARLQEGQRWAFRLTANPVTHTYSAQNPDKRKWLGHVTVDQQIQWLLDRSDKFGFEIDKGEAGGYNLSVSNREALEFKRARHGKPVTIRTATFDGVFSVTNTERLERALNKGIGRAKAYGCGLMTLAPAE